ncbi:MAG: type IV pilin protein [Smithellaceae bacterium]
MKLSGRHNEKAFTLIETIIVIVVAAILAAMMFAYSNTSLTQSAQPLNQAKKAMALQKVMENIFTDYNLNYKSNLTGIQTAIGGGVAGGNEGSTQNNSYGQYTIVANHFIKFVSNNETPDNVDPKNNNMLKVTIKNDLGETLSILLTLIIQ